VFVGVSGTDYTQIQRFRRTGENIHAGTGGAMSIIANRISHKFDLKDLPPPSTRLARLAGCHRHGV